MKLTNIRGSHPYFIICLLVALYIGIDIAIDMWRLINVHDQRTFFGFMLMCIQFFLAGFLFAFPVLNIHFRDSGDKK